MGNAIHTGPKSGGDIVTLFGSNCYDGVSAGVGVIHTGPLMIASVTHKE